MTGLLETIELRKTYRVGKVDVEALRGVSLRIQAGELAAIMGPSGCGKSSLMHILGAMAKATAGRVLIEGQDIAKMNDGERTDVRRKKIGFVFQKFNLLPTLTVQANIELAQQIRGNRSSAEAGSYLRETLQLLQIEDKLERKPSELSGGEQQRVAIARAVAKQPAIL